MSLDRLSVFVSSKMVELQAERRLIRRVLDTMQIDAWIFEHDAGARPGTIQQTYLDEIDNADLYLGVFWRDYGDRTIEEFEHARNIGRDCIVFEKAAEAGTRSPDLTAFLKRISDVERGVTIRRFATDAQLEEFLARDIARWQTRAIRSRARRPGSAFARAADVPLEDGLLPGVRPATDRAKELPAIDAAWRDPNCHILVIVGLGGAGKSSLVKAWVRHARLRGDLLPQHTFAWTFQAQANGQGTSEGSFFEALRQQLGLPARAQPADLAAVSELAQAIASRPFLLILDGFEALLGGSKQAEERTILQPIRALLSRLCGTGLCIVTTRIVPRELSADGPPAVVRLPLGGIDLDAAAAILRNAGVQGLEAELRAIARHYRGHPLALTLLAQFLVHACDGDVGGAKHFAALTDSLASGDWVKEIVAEYVAYLRRTKPVLLAVVRCIAAIDEGSEEYVIRVFIARRTESADARLLRDLTQALWQEAIHDLERMHLVNLAQTATGDRTAECHPLVRDAVQAETRRDTPEFWREINAFLATHFREQAGESQGSERIDSYCRSLVHASRSGAPRTAFSCYRQHVMGDGTQAALRQLGCFSSVAYAARAMLAAEPASPAETLEDQHRIALLGHLGSCIMALHGHTVRELEDTLIQIDDISRRAGQHAERAYANWMLHSHYLVTAKLEKTEQVAHRLTKLAQATHDPVVEVLGLERLASTRFYQGRFHDCVATIEWVTRRLDLAQSDLLLPHATILNPRAVCHMIGSIACAIMGRAEDSATHREIALQQIAAGDPLTTALVYLIVGRTRHLEGDVVEAEQWTTKSLAIADRYDMVLWRALAIVQAEAYQAAVKRQQGETIHRIEESIRKYVSIGGRIALPYCLGLLSECRQRSGDTNGARRDFDAAIEQARQSGELWYLAELLRQRGRISGSAADRTKAIDISTAQGAHLYLTRT